MSLGTFLSLVVLSSCSHFLHLPANLPPESPLQSVISLLQVARLLPSSSTPYTNGSPVNDFPSICTPALNNKRRTSGSSQHLSLTGSNSAERLQLSRVVRRWFPERSSPLSTQIQENNDHIDEDGSIGTTSNDLSLELFWLLLSRLYRPSCVRIATLRSAHE